MFVLVKNVVDRVLVGSDGGIFFGVSFDCLFMNCEFGEG